MGTERGDYAIQGGHCFLLDLVLLLEPAFLSGTQFMPFWSELCPGNVMTVKVMTITGDSKRELTVTSAYLPHKSYEPTPSKRVKGSR